MRGVRAARPGWTLGVRVAWLGFALGLVLASAAPAGAQPAGRVASKEVPGRQLFSDGRVRTFRIEVPEPGLSVLQRNDRAYVRATIREGTNVWPEVGIHLKGMGSFRPFNEKPSLAVKFDRYVVGRNYEGLTKFMLNNSSQDPTFLAELMATEMFRAAGVPAARVTHAFVEVNGRALGLYVLVEAMNKEFLRQHFADSRGNLYEAYLQDIDQTLDQDGGRDTSQADRRALLEACQVTNRLERWQRLGQVLNVDGYLSHLAVEMFTSHTDGYAMNRNNYRLYHDPSSGRFSFLAHGIDWAFANGGVSIRPPLGSIVTKAVLETPEGRRRYKERVEQLFTNVFRLESLTNRVQQVANALVQAARNPGEAGEFRHYGREMTQRLVARSANILAQLSAPDPVPARFDAAGVFALAGWRVKQDQGEVVSATVTNDGRRALHLRAAKGDVVGSWRTRVFLEEGRYRLEGLARVAQVRPLTNQVERGNGAGLRISGEKRADQLIGDTDWTRLHFDFEVMPGGDEKEMVCELRAQSGEVWFDVGSLRLRKRPGGPSN